MFERAREGFVDSIFAEIEAPDVPDVPGMIGRPSQSYYTWLTEGLGPGERPVVEVGTFLGSSTVHLAGGLARSGSDRVLHCFDRFVWRPEHANTASLPLRAGESFQPFFEANVRLVYPHLRCHPGDVLDLHWDGGPIDLLVVDAPKQLPELSALLAAFGPALEPGALTVWEDFLYFPAYPIACVLGRLADRFQLQHVVQRSHTVGLRVVEPLALDRAQPSDLQFLRWSPSEAHAAWDQVLEPLPEHARSRLEPGRMLHLYDLGESQEARRLLRARSVSEAETSLWNRLAGTHLYDRYRPLFAELGIRRRFDPRRPDDRARARRELRRGWRRFYLGSRRVARRALDRMGGQPSAD